MPGKRKALTVVERKKRQCTALTPYKPRWMRILGVAAVIATAVGTTANYTRAGQLMEVKLGYFNTVFKQQEQLGEAGSVFTKRWYGRYEKTGDVKDADKSGRPPKIPDDKAKEAAGIIGRGYDVQREVRGQLVQEHKYFRTVPEAIAHDESLRAITTTYQATPEQLLNAVHRVAPEVQQHRVTFRHKLSNAEKAHRQRVAADLLARHQTDPTLISRMVFVDETSIQTHSFKKDYISVWVNGSDPNFHDYHGVPGKSWDPVKVHVIAAVSSHPEYDRAGGLVYVDFTTGTTEIRRRVNKRLDGSTTVTNFKYTTKKKGEIASSTTSEEFEDNLWLIVHSFMHKTGQLPVLSYDNVAIQTAVNVSHLEYAQGEEGKELISLDKDLNKVDLPTYSPDMNRAIEHVFGNVKPRVRGAIYSAEDDFSKPAVLQKVVLKLFNDLPQGSVKADTKGLPLLWRVLSTAEGTVFEDPPGHQHIGTGGGYPPARYT